MSRAERLAELLKKEISNILLKKLNDHRVGFVSITDIDVSDDLKNAKVYVSCLGESEEQKKSIKGLKMAAPFIRSLLAKNIYQKNIPKFSFYYDDSLDHGSNTI